MPEHFRQVIWAVIPAQAQVLGRLVRQSNQPPSQSATTFIKLIANSRFPLIVPGVGRQTPSNLVQLPVGIQEALTSVSFRIKPIVVAAKQRRYDGAQTIG